MGSTPTGSIPLVKLWLRVGCEPYPEALLRFTIYRTTCLVNGKIYIGAHRTEDPNDSYLGSGKALSYAIQKYGREKFSKEVLFEFNTEEEMFAKEREIVTTDFRKRADTYNLVEGGDSWGMSQDGGGNRGHQRQREIAAKDPTFRDYQRDSGRTLHQRAVLKGTARKGSGFKGRTHSEDSRQKIGEANKVSNSGERNSQHGTKWVCKLGEKPLKVPMEEVSEWLGKGWHLGRSEKPRPPRTRQWVSKAGEKPRQVPLDQINLYLGSGWEKGRDQGYPVKG